MDRAWFSSYDPRVPRSVGQPDECLPILVEKAAKAFPQNPATEFFGAKLSYRNFWERVCRFANALKQLGVEPKIKVAIMLPNCPQTIIAYYATLWLGGVAVMTNPLYVEREMVHQWKDAEAELLVVLDHLYPKVAQALPQTNIRTVIVTSLREYLPLSLKYLYLIRVWKNKLFTAVPYGDHIHNFSRLLEKAPPEPPLFSASLDDLAMLQYTGGTTGISKGVMLSHRNILSNVMQLAAWVPELCYGGERFLAVLPFFHVFGMTVAMNLPLYSGSTVIAVPRFEVDGFLKTLQNSKPTLFPGVPAIFVAIVNHPKIQSYDLSSIRFCITGSAPMPMEVLRKFEALTGSIIVEGYGLSESSPVTHANPIDGVRKIGSIGLPLPDTDCRIMDLEMGVRELSFGEIGELVVRGPQVMKAYWRMPEETAQALRDGWLYTGDIATMDEAGYFYVVDRKKDMIISGGYNVYPREIDEVLYEHPKVLDAVAIGIPDEYRGEIVKAFVVLKDRERVTEEEIIGFCKSRLAPYKVPRIVEFRDTLPKSMVGKVFRRELRLESLRQSDAHSGEGVSGG